MKKRKKMNKVLKFILHLFIFIIILTLSVSAVVIKSGYDMYKEAINKVSVENRINTLKQKEFYTSFDKIPKDFKNAIVAIEDHRYYEHGPVDLFAIARATVKNLISMEFSEGASTITQQLAKNMYFSQEKKASRKIAEVFVSYDLENNYSKDEILEYYINIIYYGYYGIGQASNGYFNKKPIELNLDEITLLAGIPNAPSAYQLSNHEDLARQRQDIVIQTMANLNFLTNEQQKEIESIQKEN